MSKGKVDEAKKVLKLYAGLSSTKINLDAVTLVIGETENAAKTKTEASIMSRVSKTLTLYFFQEIPYSISKFKNEDADRKEYLEKNYFLLILYFFR